MLKVKVIATQISNLTDARYFAALGVEGLMFDYNRIGNDQFQEMREWIAGVHFYCSEPSLVTDRETMSFIGIKNLEEFQNMRDDQSCIVNLQSKWQNLDDPTKNLILEKATLTKSYLSIPVDLKEIKDLVESKRLYGLIVEGGDEEKVGLKSFNELDELFDILEED